MYVCVCTQPCSTLCDPRDRSWPDYSLSMGFSRQEYRGGLPFPSPEDLSDPGIKPASLVSPALAGGFFTISATGDIRNSGLIPG